MNYFDEYTKKYDMSNPSINYKYYHSYRVQDNMILLAKNMNLPYKDIELASTIGLLHDIGRFEQYKRFKSFNDFNLDHGDYACKLIQENDILKYFNIDKEDYDVVLTAIRNHNKFSIETDLSKRELLFSKMIRDADKLDILYALGTEKLKEVVKEDDSEISKNVREAFMNEEIIRKSPNETINDNLVTLFGFVYDINYNITLDIIKTNKYYEKIYKRLKNKEKFKPYIDKVKKYINERID